MTETQISDATLIERFQGGDDEAMNTLTRRHQARAYKFAFRLTKDQDTAGDIVADAFLRVFRSSHSFRGQSSFTTWLYRILTNCFLDMRKRTARRPTVSFDYLVAPKDSGAGFDVEGHSPHPHDTLIASEQRNAIARRMAELSDVQRVIIQLYHGEMLTYEEIASTLALPIGTVKSRLNRARLRLRVALSPERTLFGIQTIATR